MEIVYELNNSYILRLDPDEEFLNSVQNFCSQKDIKAGWLEAVGSTKDLELAYYDLQKKEYEKVEFREFLEIVTLTGNLSQKEGSTFCHAHGTFGRADMSLVGGHVARCVISATAEVVIHAGEGKVERKFDEETGLHILT